MVVRALWLSLVAILVACAAAPPAAAQHDWQRGFTLWGRPANYGSSEAKEALRQLQAYGADAVGLVVAWYVRDGRSAALRPGWNTPSDPDLVAAIAAAREHGLKVTLHLHVDVEDGSWRGFLDPPDKQGFFAGYGYFARRYARLAQESGVAGFVIGSELVQLTKPAYTKKWLALIADVRKRFAGFITYGAEWGGADPRAPSDPLREYAQIEFWPALDYIGIAAYFSLAHEGQTKVARQQLVARWQEWLTLRLAPLQATYKKPLLFTEVGYRSTAGAAARPWDSGLTRGVDLRMQADLYAALLEAWAAVPWFHGVYLWFWSTEPGAGGPYDQDYTPQGKPALAEISSLFRTLRLPPVVSRPE